MKYGYFDDKAREYVITDPRTPLPWINYLGSDDFFALVSNTAGGYCFYKDARLRRITRYRYNNNPLDQEGFRLYIKDGDTVWSPSIEPLGTPVDSYECHHGLGYTHILAAKDGIAAEQLLMVPCGQNCLINSVSLRNDSGEARSLKLFSYVEFCLWDANDDATNFQRNYSIGEVEVIGNRIYHKTEFRERRNHYAVYWCNRDVDGFDTQRDAFCGHYSGASRPEAVYNGACTGSICHGWQPIAAQQLNIELQPGEEYHAIFGLGYVECGKDKWEAPNIINKKPADELVNSFMTDEQLDAAMKELSNRWSDLLSIYQVKCEDEKLSRMVNIWNQYQVMTTFNMSRSASYFESGMGRGMGFRDSSQDLLGFVHMIPEKARQRVLDIAATQFPDGSAYHQYQPLTKRGNLAVGSGFNDDPLWLIAAVDAYLRETGDWAILDETVDFDNDPALADSLMEHLRRSFNYTVDHKGPHGLPLIGRADWNDCLNLNCFSDAPGESFQTTGPSEGPVAESVFIAGMFVKYGTAYAEIAERQGFTEEAAKARHEIDDMIKAIKTAGWDGEWFLRAYDANGDKVGSHECEEGQIFIEPQGMCVMAGVGADDGMAQQAMNSVKSRLDTKYGVVLNQPAYTKYYLNLGEISSYPPGYKENAGIFCHNNPWITIAETVLGNGNNAFEYYSKICPAYLEDISEIHRTEPYVYSQMIAGKDAPTFGEAKNSWLTGTAAWTFVSISQAILGVSAGYDGLIVKPCLPDSLKEVSVTRKFRGATYNIHITNKNGSTVETVLPLASAGETVEVNLEV